MLRENHRQPRIFYTAKLLCKRQGKIHTVDRARFLIEKIIKECALRHDHFENWAALLSPRRPLSSLALLLLCLCPRGRICWARGVYSPGSQDQAKSWSPERQNILPKQHWAYIQVLYQSLSPVSCPQRGRRHQGSYPKPKRWLRGSCECRLDVWWGENYKHVRRSFNRVRWSQSGIERCKLQSKGQGPILPKLWFSGLDIQEVQEISIWTWPSRSLGRCTCQEEG